MAGELIIFGVVLGAVIAMGGVVGILVSRHLTSWEQRHHEEPRDGDD
jgi:hypothetical protein